MYVLYFVLWVIFNANITPEICLFGLAIAAVIFAFTCKFMGHSLQKELEFYRKSWKFLCYICVLVIEIVKANLAVVKMILSQREEIRPVIVDFHSDMKTSLGQTLLANAITLTPGTITVSLEDGQYEVHCLDENLAEGMDTSVFVKMLSELERRNG
ncbi:MAG: Na+/H+ antiporter subunit E [Eubacteriales bacterium]|nr:Na+/H+ antiporter subunit E [Eubacteriales bacterium]